jgi:hypothetical protein
MKRSLVLKVSVLAVCTILVLWATAAVSFRGGRNRYTPVLGVSILYISDDGKHVMEQPLDGSVKPSVFAALDRTNSNSRIVLLPSSIDPRSSVDEVVSISRDNIADKWSVWLNPGDGSGLTLIEKGDWLMGSALDLWEYGASSYAIVIGDNHAVGRELKRFPQKLLDLPSWTWAGGDDVLGFQSRDGLDAGKVYRVGNIELYDEVLTCIRVSESALVAEFADGQIMLLDGVREIGVRLARGRGIAASRRAR